MIRGKISFQIWAQDNNTFWMIFKKIRQKWLVKKSKFVWRKKNPPRAQIFRYFRIESRNKNKKSHSKFYWIEDRVPWTVVVGIKVFVRAPVLQKAEKLSEEKLKDVGLFSGDLYFHILDFWHCPKLIILLFPKKLVNMYERTVGIFRFLPG